MFTSVHAVNLYSFSDMLKGYLCFVVSIFCIGVVTAVIGDVASHFGATVGVKDAVTAIMFVALGTSIPGTFTFFYYFFHMNLTYRVLNKTSLSKSLISHKPVRPLIFHVFLQF